jgi:hypothetical protein
VQLFCGVSAINDQLRRRDNPAKLIRGVIRKNNREILALNGGPGQFDRIQKSYRSF